MAKHKVGEKYRLQRLAAGDPNAIFETNEIDEYDIIEGGDGIVYADNAKEAEDIRERINNP